MLHSIQFWFYERKLRKLRRQVIDAMAKHPEGATLQTIAVEAGLDIRTTQAIVTVLMKQGLILTSYQNNSKIWRIVNGII